MLKWIWKDIKVKTLKKDLFTIMCKEVNFFHFLNETTARIVLQLYGNVKENTQR